MAGETAEQAGSPPPATAMRDGGTPMALLPSVNVIVGSDSRALSYTSDDPLLIGDRLIAKIWFVIERAENPQTAIFVAAAPLP